MAQVQEYRITVSHVLAGGSEEGGDAAVTLPAEGGDVQAEKTAKKAGTAGTVAKAIALQIGQQAVQFGLSNYGNLTGDYLTGERLSAAVEISGMAAAIAAAPALGIPAAILNVGTKALDYYIRMQRSEQQARFMRERLGLSTSGGRNV